MTPLHKAALEYAARGTPVFPIEPGGKRPATDHSFKDATTDADRINIWWAAMPYANIGTEPAASHLAVIDIDNKGGKNGSATWEALPDAPPTRAILTPNGGYHLYFMGDLPPSVGKLGDGLDIRGRGSYVLLPPSVVDSRPYAIISDIAPAPLPGWIEAELAKPGHQPATAPEGVILDPPGAEEWAIDQIVKELLANGAAVEGNGVNDRRFRLAATLRDGPQYGYSVSEELAVRLLNDYWMDSPRTAETVRNAYHVSGQNAPGCGPASSNSRKYDPALGVRPFDLEHALADEPRDPEVAAEIFAEGHKADGVHLATYSEADMQPIEWLWKDWLAVRKFHLLAGSKGDGKSTLVFNLMAQLTVGGLWPDGTQAPKGDVLIWSGEDDIRDVILPRMVAAGGDLRRVHFPTGVIFGADKRVFDPATDFPALGAAMHPNIKMVLVDPIVSAASGDSHKNAEVRRSLQPLVDFAVAHNVALLGITHHTKNTQGRDPVERITGSLAFGALARITLATSKGDEEGSPRKLVRTASNIGVSGGGFEYVVQQVPVRADIMAQRIVWGKMIIGSARDLLGDGTMDKSSDRAEALLLSMLSDPNVGTAGILMKEIKNAAEAHDIPWASVRRSKEKLGVQAFKMVGEGATPWAWRLPQMPPT